MSKKNLIGISDSDIELTFDEKNLLGEDAPGRNGPPSGPPTSYPSPSTSSSPTANTGSPTIDLTTSPTPYQTFSPTSSTTEYPEVPTISPTTPNPVFKGYLPTNSPTNLSGNGNNDVKNFVNTTEGYATLAGVGLFLLFVGGLIARKCMKTPKIGVGIYQPPGGGDERTA